MVCVRSIEGHVFFFGLLVTMPVAANGIVTDSTALYCGRSSLCVFITHTVVSHPHRDSGTGTATGLLLELWFRPADLPVFQ